MAPNCEPTMAWSDLLEKYQTTSLPTIVTAMRCRSRRCLVEKASLGRQLTDHHTSPVLTIAPVSCCATKLQTPKPENAIAKPTAPPADTLARDRVERALNDSSLVRIALGITLKATKTNSGDIHLKTVEALGSLNAAAIASAE